MEQVPYYLVSIVQLSIIEKPAGQFFYNFIMSHIQFCFGNILKSWFSFPMVLVSIIKIIQKMLIWRGHSFADIF